MKPTLTVAITGHRDMVETPELVRQVEDFLQTLSKQYRDYAITLLSPLADGADRFVAQIFLEQNIGRLIVPMPFDQERYMEDFDAESKAEFLAFLERAERVFPVERVSQSGYLDVGRYVVDTCDILLAIWDGIDNGKVGGTSDIVKYAKAHNHQIVEFHCERG